MSGSLEDLDIKEITTSSNQLRFSLYDLTKLAESIRKIGLLQPIIVRTNSSKYYEVVAGHRRLNACRKLGLRKIACHIVDLDDKTAFEISLIENVQRHTLNPIEEGVAFRKYVSEYGWGGVSELAEKLSISTSYICKRIKLTQLPKDIIDLISKFEISASVGEELFSIVDKNTQSKLTKLIHERQLSSRMVRKLVKELGAKNSDTDYLYHTMGTNEYEKIHRIFDKIIISLRIFVKKLTTIIENAEDKWIFYDILMQHKRVLDQQIDLLLKEKRKYKKYWNTLATYH